MKEVLLRKSDQLNGATRNYFEKLKNLVGSEGTGTDHSGTFTNKEVKEHLKIKGTTLRRYHNHLLDVGLIKIQSGKAARGYVYEIVSRDEYERLKNRINSVLDAVLKNCECVCSPKPKRR